MTGARWTPYCSSLSGLQAGINRMFADVLGFGSSSGRTSGFCPWRPPVDIIETEDSYVLTAEIPGVEREAISIEIRDNVLTLCGKRSHSEACWNGRYHRSERIFGAFERSFSIPFSVDPGAVRASLKDGVLQISLPMVGKTDTRKIEID